MPVEDYLRKGLTVARQVCVGGLDQEELLSAIRSMLAEARPKALGLAFAFVSVNGMAELTKLLRHRRIKLRRLVAGTDYAITHPEALRAARDGGWEVRICKARGGVFHPKIIVGGEGFESGGRVGKPCCAYIGSGNLTLGGLKRNVECAVLTVDATCLTETSLAFASIWRRSEALTESSLNHYAAVFAKRNRERSPKDIASLGINDSGEKVASELPELLKKKPPRSATFSDGFAAEVWTEVKSFTGGFRFQVEFPKSAAKVLRRLIGKKKLPKNKVEVLCVDDVIRKMTCRYYPDNAMYRMNVPNTLEGVNRVRRDKSGIALVRRGPEGGPPISLALLPPGAEMREVVLRSVSLGTWGRTRTRLYGWY
jgi:HKD family nuclease